ncbi:MAG: hypothetical protein HYV07_11130 [Deltaproteobacteria bacterium]|nr:hypothetical protein [Deltaproteobacteria bacterium]
MRLDRALSAALSALLACSDGAPCWEDSACQEGERCHHEDPENPGVCVACSEAEVYYDGADNDCKAATPDLDQDLDGDFWSRAPVGAPGLDCNDADPSISGKLPEVCQDGKDNDCDGRVDEAECNDVDGPTISIRSPNDEDFAFGVIEVQVEAADDIGIDRVELFPGREGTPVAATLFDPPYTFFFDTTQLADGHTELRAKATDFAGKSATARIFVTIDNLSEPEITLLPPPELTKAYGGGMTLRFSAVDLAGIDRAEVQVGGAIYAAEGFGPYSYTIDTRLLADGPQPITVRAIDRVGSVGAVELVVRIDNTPPTVSWVAPIQGQILSPPGDHAIEVHSDDPSGVSLIRAAGLSSAASPLVGELDTRGLPNGFAVLTATAADQAIVDDATIGNVGTATISVVFDDGRNVPCVNTTPFPLSSNELGGDTTGAPNGFETACADAGASDVAIEYEAPTDLVELTADLAADFPAVLATYVDACGLASQTSCEVGRTVRASLRSLHQGQLVVFVVDGARAAEQGTFRLRLGGRIEAGFSCDPASSAFTCDLGQCLSDGNGGAACPPILDCPDGFDNDGNGLTDEDLCESPAILACPPDQDVPVLSPFSFSAVESATSPVLRRTWTVVSQPLGSDVTPYPNDSPSSSIHPLLSGEYVLRYTVIDSDLEAVSCETRLYARSDDALRVELIWNPTLSESAHQSDVDLHMLHPNARRWWDSTLDCHYLNTNPEWSAAGPNDNPRLDLDDVDGRGPENINIRTPPINASYRVGVHYFSDHGYGPSEVYVNVYCFDVLKQAFGPTTLTDDQFWKVADVRMGAMSCTVTAILAAGQPVIVTNEESMVGR